MTTTSAPTAQDITVAYNTADAAWERYASFARLGVGTKEERLIALRKAFAADERVEKMEREYTAYLETL